MDLGKKIETLRKRKGLTQEGLAFRAGVSRQSVFKWECGESTPSIDKLKELAKLFEVSIDYLLNDDIDDSQNEKDENTSNVVTKTYRKVFVSETKLDFDNDVAIQEGYITGNKYKSPSMVQKFEDLNVKVLKNLQYDKELYFCLDSKSRILIDTKNNTLAVYSELSEQFVCPFENLVSISLSDGGPRTTLSEQSISGAAIGLNGGAGIVMGSGTSFSKGLSAIYKIGFTYHDENGNVHTYTFKATAYRNYLLHTSDFKDMRVYNIYVDGICNEIKNNLIKMKAELEAIIFDSKPKKDLQEIDIAVLKKQCADASKEFEAPKTMIRARAKKDDSFINGFLIFELIIGPILLLIVGIVITAIAFNTSFKDIALEYMLKFLGPGLIVAGGIALIYGIYKYSEVR